MNAKFHFPRLCFIGVFALLMVSATKNTYKHEVRSCSAVVSADKMNVFYMGVDNPISVAAGIDCSELQVRGEGVEVMGSNGRYIVRASKPGVAKIIVSGGGMSEIATSFRVKRIPDPVVLLGGTKSSGTIGSGEMQAQKGLLAMMDNFDLDMTCAVQSYTMYYTKPNQTPIEVKGIGATFTDAAAAAIQTAQPGDQYAFIDVKARCPGDLAARQINGLAFMIK